MKVHLETVLDCPIEKAWAEVQKPALLLEVAKPMARIVPISPRIFPDVWESGEAYFCKIYIFWFIPTGTRRLCIASIHPKHHRIQSIENDTLVKRWDHLIAMEPEGERTRYSDEIEIDAGILTPLIWLYALVFYSFRQWKWRRIAKRLKAS